MDPSSLRVEFEKQLKDAEVKIAKAEEQVEKLKEYKTKLIGGLETLELLNPKPETQDGPPEPTTPALDE
jgi:hypothetical protein